MSHRIWIVAAYVLAWLGTSFLQAADWPQWRGPQRTGISQEGGLLHEWPKDGPRLVWQIKDAGSGFSTPAVAEGRIYLLGNEGAENEFVQARDPKDGSLIWTQRIGKVGKPDQQPPYPGARSTPTVDGIFLYALGSNGDVACLDCAKGGIRWTKNVVTDFGGESGIWAYSESPLIDGDTLVCTPGGKDATIIALDKHSGQTLWKCPLPDGDQAAYSSAIAANIGGVKQYVQFVQKSVVGVDAQTGKLLWSYGNTAKGSMANIPTPIADGSMIYTATGMVGCGLVTVKKDNGAFLADQVYFNAKLPKAIGGAVLKDGFLYGTTNDAMECVDFKTGDIKWSDRSIGPGAVLYADGNLYLHGENGQVALVEATPDAYREKGRFTPVDAPDHPGAGVTLKAWAYPVVANGKLYVRDQGQLWCYDVKAQ